MYKARAKRRDKIGKRRKKKTKKKKKRKNRKKKDSQDLLFKPPLELVK